MNYAEIKACDIANGPGVRVSLFVSGCPHHCKGCFNPETWDFQYGETFDDLAMRNILNLMKPDYIKGLTILGGEPLAPENREEVLRIIEEVKEVYPEKSIWLYTGYISTNLTDHICEKIFRMVDIVVDGPFIEELKDLSLQFRGSSNQRILLPCEDGTPCDLSSLYDENPDRSE